MVCRCGSENQKEFPAEIMIHFSGLPNVNKPAVLIFPKIEVCLDCGVTQFTIPGVELGKLKGGQSSAA